MRVYPPFLLSYLFARVFFTLLADLISCNFEICKDILLIELKKDEEIVLKAYVIKGTGKKHSKFQSTGTIYFKIKKNMKIDKILWNKLSKKEKESIIYFNYPNTKIKNSKAFNSMSIMEFNSNMNVILGVIVFLFVTLPVIIFMWPLVVLGWIIAGIAFVVALIGTLFIAISERKK